MPEPSACPDTPRLEQFLSGELNEGEQKALELHIEGCASCQRSLEALLPTNRSWVDVLGKPKVRAGDPSEVTQPGCLFCVWLIVRNRAHSVRNEFLWCPVPYVPGACPGRCGRCERKNSGTFLSRLDIWH